MTSSRILRQNPDLVTKIIDDEVVIMVPGEGKVLSLNEVGSFIWDVAKGGCTEDAILNAVCREYDIDREQAAADLEEFIADLKEKNLIICD